MTWRRLLQVALSAALVLSVLGASPAAAERGGDTAGDLDRKLGGDRVVRNALTGQVTFVRGTSAQPVATRVELGHPTTARAAARRFLERYGKAFGIHDVAAQLRVTKTTVDAQGRTFVRYQQVHRGVPVIAGELNVQVDRAKNVISANGEASAALASISTDPRVSSNEAKRTAVAAVAKSTGVPAQDANASTPVLSIYDPALLGGPALPLVRLVWRIDVRAAIDVDELVLVDAERGGIALRFNQIANARNRVTCDANNSAAEYPCTLGQADRTETGGAVAEADVNNAHDFAGHTYDFFFNRFGRDSLDGAGMTLYSTVDYCDPLEPCPYLNAFWDGDQMVYGDGFASADDVVGHELMHGVTDHSSDLFYYYQSGAINEALSDIFGEFIDLTNGAGNDTAGVRWLMGEDIPGIGAIRDMEQPGTYGDPDRMQSPNYYAGTDDNGGVHQNSGVANKAAFLIVDGQTFNGQTITGIGIDKTAAIWYRVATEFLASGSDYEDLGSALKQACADLLATTPKQGNGTPSPSGAITTANCAQVSKAVTATEMSLQPTQPGGQAPEAPICTSGAPSNIVYDQIAEFALGWSVSGGSGSSTWYYDDSYATTSPWHLYGYAATAVAPAIRRVSGTAIPANAFLHFRHAWEFESIGTTNYDGGVVEYSVNNGASWIDAGSLVSHGGYNGTLTSGTGNPLAGRNAFVQVSNGYRSSRLNLSSLAGQNVLFRFLVSSDTSIGYFGWAIDDYRVYTCVDETPICTTPPFSDVPATHSFCPEIKWMKDNGISTGFNDGTYRPSIDVTRQAMSAFMARLAGATSLPACTTAPFSDVPATHSFCPEIRWMKDAGISSGFNDGTYRPSIDVTRQAMSAFMARLAGATSLPACTTPPFSDVPTTHSFCPEIKWMKDNNISTGFNDGTYRPSIDVTRQAMSAFMYRLAPLLP